MYIKYNFFSLQNRLTTRVLVASSLSFFITIVVVSLLQVYMLKSLNSYYDNLWQKLIYNIVSTHLRDLDYSTLDEKLAFVTGGELVAGVRVFDMSGSLISESKNHEPLLWSELQHIIIDGDNWGHVQYAQRSLFFKRLPYQVVALLFVLLIFILFIVRQYLIRATVADFSTYSLLLAKLRVVTQILRKTRGYSEHLSSLSTNGIIHEDKQLIKLVKIFINNVRISKTTFSHANGEHIMLPALKCNKYSIDNLALFAHELKAPCAKMSAFILGISSLSNNRQVKSFCNQHLESMRLMLNKLRHSIDSIVTLSAPFPIRVSLLKPQVLELLLQQQFRSYSVIIEKRNLHYSLSLQHTKQPYVDINKLQRSCSNLLDNAFAASSSDASIWVKSKDTSTGIVIIVGNSGSYVQIEDRSRIFKPFVTSTPGSSGLGLAICKDFVTHYGGTIKCLSDDRCGTEFVMTIPC